MTDDLVSKLFPAPPAPSSELGRYRTLAPSAAVRVSPFFLGAMSIGTAWSEIMGAMNKEESFKLLDAFVAAGGNAIDTSNNYQNEESEQILGEWMAERQNRDKIVLSTKFTMNFRGYEIGPFQSVNFSGNNRKSLHLSIRASLQKLQTDYIDILFLHVWDHTTSIREVMDSLDVLVKQGKVLYLGISDTPAWIVAAANTYALENGKTPFSVYQGRWNIMVRDLEREIVPMCREFGMAIIPWDVVGGGKFKTAKEIQERTGTLRWGLQQTEQEAKISAALEKVAKEVGTESLTAVALAYVMSKYPWVYPIVGGRKIEHLHQNIQALSLRLSMEQIKYLESIVPFDLGFPHNFIGTKPEENQLVHNAPMSFVQPQQPVQLVKKE